MHFFAYRRQKYKKISSKQLMFKLIIYFRVKQTFLKLPELFRMYCWVQEQQKVARWLP